MEYFIGIVPPTSYGERVSDFQRRWSEGWLPDFVEPHVTVKAQGGLTDDVQWLETMREVCAAFPPFELALGEPGWFGQRVFFLTVQSEPFYVLHRRLVEAVNLTEEQRKRYFEGDDFHAHLTLGIAGQGVSEADLIEMSRLAVEELQPYPHFQVTFVRVYQYDGILGGGYRKWVDLPLMGCAI